jgi:hypothetical protein
LPALSSSFSVIRAGGMLALSSPFFLCLHSRYGSDYYLASNPASHALQVSAQTLTLLVLYSGFLVTRAYFPYSFLPAAIALITSNWPQKVLILIDAFCFMASLFLMLLLVCLFISLFFVRNFSHLEDVGL